MAALPKTKARLATSIKLFYIKTGALVASTLSNPKVLDQLQWKLIDGVEKFHETEDRVTEPRYETDGKKTGDVMGRIIKTVEKKISIDRTVMYKDDVLDFFDFANTDSTNELVNQTSGFVIAKVEKAPSGSGIQFKTTLYMDCYVHNIPKTYELGRDMKVVQAINLGYIDKFSFEGATAGAGT